MPKHIQRRATRQRINFAGFAFWPADLLGETLIKFTVLNILWVPVHLLWLMAGVKLKALALTPRAQTGLNMSMALAMLAVVALATFG